MAGLSGLPVVVTGAAQGIGLGIARRLSADGAALALLDRNGEALQAAQEDLATAGARTGAMVWSRVVDVTDVPAVRTAVAAAHRALGGIGGLVNNAGVGPPQPFFDLTVEQWRRTLEVNLTATFVLTQEVGRRMAAAGRGRIVNISSIAGKTGSPTPSPTTAPPRPASSR